MKNKKQKNTIMICVIVLIVLVVLVIKVLDMKQESDELSLRKHKMGFVTEAQVLYKTAVNKYEEGSKYYARLNGVSCKSNFITNEYYADGIPDGISYYVAFDESGNITKLYIYNDEYKYLKEGTKIEIDDFVIEELESVGNYTLTCEEIE